MQPHLRKHVPRYRRQSRPHPNAGTVPRGASFIEKRGEGIHHVAFCVDNAANALKEVEEKGVRLIDKTPRPGAEGLMIGFLHPKSTGGVLTEFCENPNK